MMHCDCVSIIFVGFQCFCDAEDVSMLRGGLHHFALVTKNPGGPHRASARLRTFMPGGFMAAKECRIGTMSRFLAPPGICCSVFDTWETFSTYCSPKPPVGPRDVSRMSLRCPSDVPQMSRRCPADVPRMSRRCPADVRQCSFAKVPILYFLAAMNPPGMKVLTRARRSAGGAGASAGPTWGASGHQKSELGPRKFT